MQGHAIPGWWTAARLSDVSSKLVDGSHNPPAKQDKGLPMLSAVNINDNKIIFSDYRLIDEDAFLHEDRRTRIAPNDVLLTIVGAIGRAAGVSRATPRFTLQRSVAVITPLLIDSKFLMYQFESPRVALHLKKNAKGTAQKGVYLKTLGNIELWISPLSEQRRIVAKIEELFSELDKGIESLKIAQAQLKVYRQALLKHAFEGKLTAQWREENKDKLEPPEVLLKRIQAERAQRYQQQLADWEAGGKQGSKPKAPKTVPPLTAEELVELPELPQGWVYTRVGAVIDDPTYGTAKKCDYQTDGVGVLRIPNVVSGRIDASDLKFAEFRADEIGAYKVNCGDILIIRSNGSISIVGRCALVSSADLDYLYAGYLIRLRPNQCLVEPEYLLNAFSVHTVRKQIEKKAKSTSGVNNINTGEIQSLIVPLCGIDEQKSLQMEIASRLSVIDQLDLTITTSLQQAEALRQSILKKAFSGKLVPQDPCDESASALLLRIKAEKFAHPNKKKARA